MVSKFNILTTLLYLSIYAQQYDDRQIRIQSVLENKKIVLVGEYFDEDSYVIYPYEKVMVNNIFAETALTLPFQDITLSENSAQMSFYNDETFLEFDILMKCEPDTKPYRIESISDKKYHISLTLMMESACNTDASYNQYLEKKRFKQYVGAIVFVAMLYMFIITCFK